MHKHMFVIFVLFGSLTLFSCQSHKQTEIPPVITNPETPAVTECKSPRPQMCTKEYRPVCASRDTGVRCVTTPCPSTEKVTKGNACTACADEKVFSYTIGACK